jgi:hypothetical protein
MRVIDERGNSNWHASQHLVAAASRCICWRPEVGAVVHLDFFYQRRCCDARLVSPSVAELIVGRTPVAASDNTGGLPDHRVRRRRRLLAFSMSCLHAGDSGEGYPDLPWRASRDPRNGV